MTPGPLTVLVVGDAGAGELGETVGAVLRERAIEWGREQADAVGVIGRERGLRDEIEEARPAGSDKVLVVWPYLPRLRPFHAQAAAEDLDAGCDLVVGPLMDGGLYLLGFRGQAPQLAEEAWAGQDVMSSALQAARQAGVEVGLLPPERGLRGRADVAAALADPLTPDDIREMLEDA